MVRTKLLMTTAAALFTLGTAASAATLSGNADNTDFDLGLGDFFTGSANLYAGEEITYTFDVLDTLTIQRFAVAGTGFDSGSDLMNVRFGYGLAGESDVATSPYEQIFEYGSVASAVGSINGQTFSAGDSFFFSFANNGDGTDANNDLVGTTVSFDVAPIPVPAAGFLLLGALGAGAVVGRRKKAA